MRSRSLVLFVLAAGCATTGGAASRAALVECSAACVRAYGQPMPGAHIGEGGACYCAADVVLLTAKLKPSAFILNGGKMPQPEPSK